MTNQLLSREAKAAPRTVGAAPAPAADSLPLWKRLFATSDDRAALVLRLVLGGVMLPHGAQKVFGWFGGAGFSATLESFRTHLGIPLIIAVLVVFAELVGAVGLIAGFLGRLAAMCIMAVMIGAILLVHLDNGFFMNWTGAGRGEGFEYHLLAIGLTLPMLAKGSGAYSVDGWLVRLLREGRGVGR